MSKPTLYHGTFATCDANGNYTVFPEKLDPRRQKNCFGKEGDFVFASPNFLRAVSFALKSKIDNNSLVKIHTIDFVNDVPIVVMKDNKIGKSFVDEEELPTQSISKIYRKFLIHPLGAVFKVNNETFEPVLDPHGNATEEWVSHDSSKIELVEIITIEEAMRKGVQILLAQNNGTYNDAENELRQTIRTNKGNAEFNAGLAKIDFLCEQIQLGNLRHVNAEKNINPFNYETLELSDMSFVNGISISPKSPEIHILQDKSNRHSL